MRLPLLIALFLASTVAQAEKLVVYSSRAEQLIKPLFERYTEQTGVEIEFLTDKEAALIERLAAEGERTPADLLITVDAGNLWLATERGVLAAVDSEPLNKAIPAHLRDPNGHWFGLSVRARTLVYNPTLIEPGVLSTYQALAGEGFKGKLCLRSSSKVYNQSLVAMMIAEHGAETTEAMVRGWVANLAAPPFASDDEVIIAVSQGRCAVGIVNTYYYGRLKRDQPDLNVALYFANQGDGESGVHVNVSGAGVVKHSDAKAQAQAFLEWLAEGQAQQMFAQLNLEFPANPATAPDPAVAAWGSFRADEYAVVEAGRRQVDAVKLMDRAGYR